jgi:ribosomal protein L37AE/L43A
MSDSKLGGKVPRSGRKIRSMVADVERKQRATQECPKCSRAAKRVSAGVYDCPKCGKFTGGAYYV